MKFKLCSVCGIRCFPEDDFHPFPTGGGYCDRCAATGGYDWLVKHLGVDRDGFAFCPGHDDAGRPNLHVSRSKRDPRDAVLFCHAGCESDIDLILSPLGLSRWHLYHPDNHQQSGENIRQGSRVEERPDVRSGTSPTSTGTQENSKNAKIDDGDALDERLGRWRAGRLEPESVALPVERLPRQAKELRRLVAEIELWMGLRLADFEYRPMPLSQRFVARRMGWLRANGEPDDRRGWGALRKLVAHGVLVSGPSLEPRGKRPGTGTFLPPEPLATALGFSLDDAIESGAGVVEVAVSEPDAELAEEPGVDRAEAAAGQDDRMVAVRLDAALVGGVGRAGHEADYKPASGRVPLLPGGPRNAIYAGCFD